MHNITKIKLFRILLRITYLPSLILLYPFALLRKKSSTGLFFFFDRFSLGGAQRIHLDVLRSVSEIEKHVFFTRYSPDNNFREEFYNVPASKTSDVHLVCDYLLIRIFSVHYFSFYLNRHPSAHIFGANSTFFYDLLPFVNRRFKKTELLHNFTFGKNGMEFFGLQNHALLTHRIVYDYFTRDNIVKQYEQFGIQKEFLNRLLFIEPGVNIPEKKIKPSGNKLSIVCAGRGGPQKRIWLINRIAEFCIEQKIPVTFHFAGTMMNELSEKAKSGSSLRGEIADPEKMYGLLADMHILLLTSAYEGFPMIIKEAMANSCIPLVTALQGNLMHLTDQRNSLLIHEIVHEDALVKEAISKIKQLTGDALLRKKLSDGAYQYAKDHFSRVQFNLQYRELLRPNFFDTPPEVSDVS